MIVKNEEQCLPRCLESIRDAVDEIIVVDTGSEDRTVEIARSYGAKVHRHLWEDHFSRHRNQSIGYATGDWILIIDADETLYRDEGLDLKTAIEACRDVDAMLVRVQSPVTGTGGCGQNALRLFKNGLNIHYEGRVHNELVGMRTGKYMPIHILHYGYDVDADKAREKYDRTVRLLTLDVQEHPGHPRPYHYLGISHLSMNHYNQAAEAAETAIRLIEDCGDESDLYIGSYYVASTAHLNLGSLRRAEHLAEKAVARYLNHPDCLYALCGISFQKGDEKSFRDFADRYLALVQEIRKDPGRFGTMIFFTVELEWRVHLYEALMWMDKGQEEKGRQALNHALAGCPDAVHCYRLLAAHHGEQGRWPEAEKALKNAMEEGVERAEPFWDMVRLHRYRGDEENEKKWLEALTERFPQEKAAWFALGLAYVKASDMGRAAGCFEHILAIDPDDSDAMNNLALCFRKQGRFQDAVTLSLKALRIGGPSLEALSHIAHGYYEMGEHDRATQYFEQIAGRYPQALDAPVYLAQLCLSKNDILGCVSACGRILRGLGMPTDLQLESVSDLRRLYQGISEAMAACQNLHLSQMCDAIAKALI